MGANVAPTHRERAPRTVAMAPPANDGAGGAATDALGTNVQRLFLNFLDEYRDEATAGADGLPSSQAEPTYVKALRELKEADRSTLFVDFNHLLECVWRRQGGAIPADS